MPSVYFLWQSTWNIYLSRSWFLSSVLKLFSYSSCTYFARTPKILVDLLMNHIKNEMFLETNKGKQLNTRKKVSFLNVAGGLFFLSRLNSCFEHGQYFIFILSGSVPLWKRVNTNCLISFDNSLAMNVLKDLAWKTWMVSINRMAPKISIALTVFRHLILWSHNTMMSF